MSILLVLFCPSFDEWFPAPAPVSDSDDDAGVPPPTPDSYETSESYLDMDCWSEGLAVLTEHQLFTSGYGIGIHYDSDEDDNN